jgi:8-oxo-dGTP diphosphatase
MMDQKTTNVIYPDLPRVAVGAVVFKDNKVLLVKRAKPPAQGLWAIPGGSVELGETLQQAAQREILEETGIMIRAKMPIYTFDIIEKDENNRVRFHYVIVDLVADFISGQPIPGDDAAEVRWVSSLELKNLDVNPGTLKVLDSLIERCDS